jgi:D-3-phosphoglycerate dehydrogenase
MKKRLKVLLIQQPPEVREPWMTHLREAVGSEHDMVVYDSSKSMRPQFEGIDVVVDQGGGLGTREMMDCCSTVKLWQVLGTGFEKLDVPYLKQKKIPVANTPGFTSGIPLAECALVFMVMLSRRWHDAQVNLRERRFFTPFGEELMNRHLVLFGFGASAKELARRVKAFGVRMSAVDIREISQDEQREFGLAFAGGPEHLDRLLGECDFLSLHLHLNAQTAKIIDDRRLRLMKPTACLINVARGGLVDQDALYSALKEGRLAGAGLDVFAVEPIDPQDPLLQLPNVIGLPHVSGTTSGTSRRRAQCIVENLERVATGGELLYRVD